MNRLRIVSKPLIFKRRQTVRRAAVAVVAAPNDLRSVDAEIIHGDEQEFWGEKRWFYRSKLHYMPSWDRFAQTLISFSQTVPRVPQEAAFRIFAVFLKLTMIQQLVDLSSLLLPSWQALNVQGLLTQAKKDDSNNDEQKK